MRPLPRTESLTIFLQLNCYCSSAQTLKYFHFWTKKIRSPVQFTDQDRQVARLVHLRSVHSLLWHAKIKAFNSSSTLFLSCSAMRLFSFSNHQLLFQATIYFFLLKVHRALNIKSICNLYIFNKIVVKIHKYNCHDFKCLVLMISLMDFMVFETHMQLKSL